MPAVALSQSELIWLHPSLTFAEESSATRRARAALQLRDRHGRWIEMGGGLSFHLKPPSGGGPPTTMHGIVVGGDNSTGQVHVRLPNGGVVSVPANKTEQPKAVIGLHQGAPNDQSDPASAPTSAPGAGQQPDRGGRATDGAASGVDFDTRVQNPGNGDKASQRRYDRRGAQAQFGVKTDVTGPPELTPQEVHAAESYFGAWYKGLPINAEGEFLNSFTAVNQTLRDGTLATGLANGETWAQDIQKVVDGLDSLISRSRLVTPTRVFRGLNLKNKKTVTEFLSSLVPGAIVTTPAFSSTTIDKGWAYHFLGGARSNQVVLAIDLPAGTPIGRGGLSFTNSGFKQGAGGEGEFLLPRNAQLKVRSVETQPDGTTLVRLDHVNTPIPGSQNRPAVRADDKRTTGGQTRTNFINETTGAPMGKTETGDTFEQLFAARGKQLVEKRYGNFSLVTGAGSGTNRTTALDLISTTHGGELKTMSSNSKNLKTAIKAEEIQRKLQAVGDARLKPLLLVQVVNQDTHTIDLYGMENFASKAVSKMEHFGSYSYTPQDFTAAQTAAGHASKAVARAFQGMTPAQKQEHVKHVNAGVPATEAARRAYGNPTSPHPISVWWEGAKNQVDPAIRQQMQHNIDQVTFAYQRLAAGHITLEQYNREVDRIISDLRHFNPQGSAGAPLVDRLEGIMNSVTASAGDPGVVTPPDPSTYDGQLQPDNSGGVMIALKIPNPELYAVPDGTDPEDLHITLAYLGHANELSPEQKDAVLSAAKNAATQFGKPVSALFPADYGTFPPGEDGTPFWLSPHGQDLDELHQHVVDALTESGLGDKISTDHAFNPHVTLQYLQGEEQVPHPDYTPPPIDEVSFPTMRVSIGDDEHQIPLAEHPDALIRPQQILFSVEERIQDLLQTHNTTSSRATRATMPMLKAVYSREFIDALPSPSRTVTASALSRCEEFLSALACHDTAHSDADLYPVPVPQSLYEAALVSSVRLQSDRIKDLLMDAAVASPYERAFSLARALAAAATSPSPRVRLDLIEPLRTLLADGLSSAARSLRAKLQLRDRHGRWIDEGKGVSFKVRTSGGTSAGTWYHGTVVGQNVGARTVSVRLPDNRIVSVPANKLEQPLAIIGQHGENVKSPLDPAKLDANAPTIAGLNVIAAPDNSQGAVTPAEINAAVDGIKADLTRAFHQAPSAESRTLTRMLAALHSATLDSNNLDPTAVDNMVPFIDQFLREHPNLNRSQHNALVSAQNELRDLSPVLGHHQANPAPNPASPAPQHHVQLSQAERRPFRTFNDRGVPLVGDTRIPPRWRGLPQPQDGSSPITVNDLQAPHYQLPGRNGNGRSTLIDELQNFLRNEYNVQVLLHPNAQGHNDPNSLSLRGDKTRIDAALQEVWGLQLDDHGHVVPVTPTPDPTPGDVSPVASVEAAVHALENLSPAFADPAQEIRGLLRQVREGGGPNDWANLSDSVDGARQVVDLIAPGADPAQQPALEAASRALDAAASNSWSQARPGTPQTSAPQPGDDRPLNAAVNDIFNKLGDLEDSGHPAATSGLRDALNQANTNLTINPTSEQLNHFADQLHEIAANLENQFNGVPQTENVNQEHAVRDLFAALDTAAGEARGLAGPSAAQPGPGARDQFGGDVPQDFTFNSELVSQDGNTKIQLYDYQGADGRAYQVAVRPSPRGGLPLYAIRSGSTHNGEQRWSIRTTADNWSGVTAYLHGLDDNARQHDQFEANRRRAEANQAVEAVRVQQDHTRRVAENVDDGGRSLPAGWTRHLDESNNVYYQGPDGALVYDIGAPDHALGLYMRDSLNNARIRIGIYDDWGQVANGIREQQSTNADTTRQNLITKVRAALGDRFDPALADRIMAADSVDGVQVALAADPAFTEFVAQAAHARGADRMHDWERQQVAQDNAISSALRAVNDRPAAPAPAPAPRPGNHDELGRPLPEGWALDPTQGVGEGLYMGPGGATAFIDQTRNNTPITLTYNNHNGAPIQVTNLPNWEEVSQTLTQADRGINPAPANTSRDARNVATGGRDAVIANLRALGVEDSVSTRIGNLVPEEVRNYVADIPQVRDARVEIANEAETNVDPRVLRGVQQLDRALAALQDLPGHDVPNASDAALPIENILRQIGVSDRMARFVLDTPDAVNLRVNNLPDVQVLRREVTAGRASSEQRRNLQVLDEAIAEHDRLLGQLFDRSLSPPGNGTPNSTPGPSGPQQLGPDGHAAPLAPWERDLLGRPPEGSPGNPNDVRDSGEPPQAPPRVGAPPGFETRYHTQGVITDRNGRVINVGDRVASRRDGVNITGVVTAIQQQPPYARVRWPDGRTQVRAGARLENMTPIDLGNRPAAPAPVVENPAPAALAVPQGSALQQVQDIAAMHVAGQNQGYPLVSEIGDARNNINMAVTAIEGNNRQAAIEAVTRAVGKYRDGIAGGLRGNAGNRAFSADVGRRLAAAEQLLTNLQNPNFPLTPPSPSDARANLERIRASIPTRAGRDRTPASIAYRNAGLALQDALDAHQRGDQAGRLAATGRVDFLLRNNGRAGLADEIKGHLATLLGDQPAPVGQGAVPEPRDYIANRFEGDRAPRAASPATPGVIDPRDTVDHPAHAQAPNPNAAQVDYAAWGPRAAEIAQAARIRPSIDAIVAASPNEAAQLINEAFGGLDGITFGREHYTLDVTSSVGPYNVSLSVDIKDSNGRRIGRASRALTKNSRVGGEWVASNQSMTINDTTMRSTGFANAINRYFENFYIANGFKEVRVSAAGGSGYTGGFAWAMNGFGWNSEDGGLANTNSILRGMSRSARGDSVEQAQIQQMTARVTEASRTRNKSLIPTPMELALVGWSPGKTSWLGKTTMKGQSWGGHKILQPTSVNWQQRQNYEIAKQAETRLANSENQFNVSRPFANQIATMQAPGLADAGISQPEAEMVGKVMRSTNPSIASLPFTTKKKLYAWANDQVRGGNWTSDMQSIIDTSGRDLAADYPRENTLGVGQVLANTPITAFEAKNVPGFTVRKLGRGETGVNATFIVTHDASGQVFYVKRDRGRMSNAAITTSGAQSEHDVNMLLRNVGWPGIDSTGLGQGGNADPVLNMVTQHRVGDNLDLVARPGTGGQVTLGTTRGAMNNLAQADQAVRMVILDALIANTDRHGGNFMLGQGIDGKWHLFPIDHGLTSVTPDGAERTDPIDSARRAMTSGVGAQWYADAVNALTNRMSEENLHRMLQHILSEYRNGASTNANEFSATDFSRKMIQNAQLMESRMSELADILMGRTR